MFRMVLELVRFSDRIIQYAFYSIRSRTSQTSSISPFDASCESVSQSTSITDDYYGPSGRFKVHRVHRIAYGLGILYVCNHRSNVLQGQRRSAFQEYRNFNAHAPAHRHARCKLFSPEMPHNHYDCELFTFIL